MSMPVLWGFFLKDMPSGLVLYWLFSNLLTIVQQLRHESSRQGRQRAAAGQGRQGAQAGARVRSGKQQCDTKPSPSRKPSKPPRKALGKPAAQLRYTVIRDEKSFWGGRVVEIEVEGGSRARSGRVGDGAGEEPGVEPRAALRCAASEATPAAAAWPPATEAEALAVVEATLTELLSAAGLLVETRRRVHRRRDALRAHRRRRRAAARQQGRGPDGPRGPGGPHRVQAPGRPVHPRLDAEGFRAHQKEALEELAQRRPRGPPHAAARSCCRRSRRGNGGSSTSRSRRTPRSRPRARATGS